MSLNNKIKHSIHKVTDPFKRILRRKSLMAQEKVTSNEALQWCQNFLRGAWSSITIEDMRMERISGGLSNYLYCCSLPENVQPLGDEPRKVLLRVYGEAHKKHRGTLLIDSVVCTLLSERKLGPRVHGIFPEGRLEEFIESESLRASEIRDPKTSRKIGRLLGELHQLDMPLVKEPIWLYYTIERHLSDLPTDTNKFEIEEDREIFQELRSVCNFTEEFEQLKKLLASIQSPVCFTHNDFQPGNILRLKSHPEKFTVIDFEYCSYNYRGFDIGNHFCEFMFDYTSSKAWPFFNLDFTLYPNKIQQINFLSSYADAIISSANEKANEGSLLSTNNNNREELIDQLMKEANYFALASHFFWTLWSINMATSTAIKFGYMEYARARLTAYYVTRNLLVGANEIPPRFSEDILRSDKNPFNKSYTKINNEQSVN
ncbi:unnamed protein product [Rotaria socialis]|uniref:Choline kinase n=2 Tax=Rotaria socialis TaxID=392032 RepID=A0A818YLH4_9BILA|nr:unnamed protein product [Rotaria socialis]CAF3431615.1 unnamed protein product [Rotaria socialis]CAF3631386.1 unnamed protein product [Rotaria socialis]CAF3755920.1 unnamed protein product [Rotaria socialis]